MTKLDYDPGDMLTCVCGEELPVLTTPYGYKTPEHHCPEDQRLLPSPHGRWTLIRTDNLREPDEETFDNRWVWEPSQPRV